MVKTAPLNHDTYMYLKKVQMILLEKYRRSITIADILSGMSNILTDAEDTAKKIIMMRRRDHEDIMSIDTEHGNNGGESRHPEIIPIEDEDIKT